MSVSALHIYIEQWIKKEQDRYPILRMYTPLFLQSVVEHLVSLLDNQGWSKDLVLLDHRISDSFYQVIGFDTYLQDYLESRSFFERSPILLVCQRILSRQSKECSSELDQALYCIPPFLGWTIPEHYFLSLVNELNFHRLSLHKGADVEMILQKYLQKRFPLSFEQLWSSLKIEDQKVWEKTALWIKSIAQRVTNTIFPTSIYKDLLADVVWTESFQFLQNKIIHQENTLVFDHPAAFKGYVYKLCRLTLYSQQRNYMNQTQWLEEGAFQEQEEEKEEDVMASVKDMEDGPLDFLAEIDWKDSYQVAQLISTVLLNPHHILYPYIVEQDGDKVEVLLASTIQGLTYKELVRQRAGDTPISSMEEEKQAAQLRQETLRLKKRLKERMISILQNPKQLKK